MFDWMDRANRDIESRHGVLSFHDYMKKVEKRPLQECRPTFKYLTDMLRHFGAHRDGGARLFEQEDREAAPVFGQHKVQEALIQNLTNFQEEGFNNKFILLVGPNGSSKSSIVRKFIRGAEIYSQTEEGAVYTFSWIFPVDNFIKGPLGLSKDSASADIHSFAHLEDKDISSILVSDMKDHPLLLVPMSYRQKILKERLSADEKFFEAIKKSYLYTGDLSKKNRMIYDALLKNYKGRHQDVLKHVRVERFEISKRYSVGAVTIEPQIHVDAKMQQITMDKRLANLPSGLQSLNLFSLKGEVVMANRGVLEYSDLLKRPLDTYKYLLMTMETKNINLQGILTELDIFFVGTSNEIHLAAFKQHPDFNSFKGRFNFVRVPYLLNYREEKKIYRGQILGLAEKCRFEPHSLKALCLFSVMTRLRCPQEKHYSDKKLARLVTTVNPLEKALFFASGKAPERFDLDSQQILQNGLKEIRLEFELENLYEGKFGISPRDVKNIIYKISGEYENITFLEIVEYLQKLILKKNDYDFLNMTPQADYHHPTRFIALVKNYCLDLFDRELRDSLGMVDNRSYEDYIQRYIENIRSAIKDEKIKNRITGRYEKSDRFFIEEFEANVQIKENPDSFRSHILSKLGAYSLDNPGKSLNYREIFPSLTERLMESFRNEQKKVIQEVSKHLVFFENDSTGQKDPVSRQGCEKIRLIMDHLNAKYGHSQKGALTLTKQLIKERY